MFEFLKSIFKTKQCHFCKSKKGYFTKYKVKDEDVYVCPKCLEYAERRAFKKV